jgi:hypothetical protein
MNAEEKRMVGIGFLMVGGFERVRRAVNAQQIGGYLVLCHPTAKQADTAVQAVTAAMAGGWRYEAFATATAARHFQWKLQRDYPDGVLSFLSSPGASDWPPPPEQLDLALALPPSEPLPARGAPDI